MYQHHFKILHYFTFHSGLCSCQNILKLDGPLYRAVGENVEFKLNTPPSQPPTSITWRYTGSLIINVVENGQETGNAYKGRIVLSRSTASFELQNLSLNDSGEYTLTISTDGVSGEGKTLLTVLGMYPLHVS